MRLSGSASVIISWFKPDGIVTKIWFIRVIAGIQITEVTTFFTDSIQAYYTYRFIKTAFRDAGKFYLIQSLPAASRLDETASLRKVPT